MKSSLLPLALVSSAILMAVDCGRYEQHEEIEDKNLIINNQDWNNDLLLKKNKLLLEKFKDINLISYESHRMFMETLNYRSDLAEDSYDDLNDENCASHYFLMNNDFNEREEQDQYIDPKDKIKNIEEDKTSPTQKDGVNIEDYGNDFDLPIDDYSHAVHLEELNFIQNLQDVDIEEEDSQ